MADMQMILTNEYLNIILLRALPAIQNTGHGSLWQYSSVAPSGEYYKRH
jgi:hypothetical protein